MLDCTGTDTHPARSFSVDTGERRSGVSRHAGGLCAVSFPWKVVRVFDAIERDGPGERNQRRRADTRVSRPRAELKCLEHTSVPCTLIRGEAPVTILFGMT